tara:strand:+ start:2388 stop:2981 length:594 start_codon:yes stop_codon:yes gene_type:complete
MGSPISKFNAAQYFDIDEVRKTFQKKGTHDPGSVGARDHNPLVRNAHIWSYDEFEVVNPVRQMFEDINKKAFQYSIIDIQVPQLCVYYGRDTLNQSVDGHYTWHKDTRLVKGYAQRVLSMSILMNDATEYEGGELEILTGISSRGKPLILKAGLQKAGDAIVFDSMMDHRVTPVTKGTRATLVTWCFGSHKSPEFFK